MLNPRTLTVIDEQEADVHEVFSDAEVFMPEGMGGYPSDPYGLVGSVITIVAVRGGVKTDWAAYWASFILRQGDADNTMQWNGRVRTTRYHGSKVPKEVAEEMFPRAADEWGYYRA
jgi:hypothetical protein